MSKYEVISGPYFPVFGLNTGKYGPEITSYFDTFYAVYVTWRSGEKGDLKKHHMEREVTGEGRV